MDAALAFVGDLRSRLTNRVQLTSDGHRPYLTAVDAVFGDDVEYAKIAGLADQTQQVKVSSSLRPDLYRFHASRFLLERRPL